MLKRRARLRPPEARPIEGRSSFLMTTYRTAASFIRGEVLTEAGAAVLVGLQAFIGGTTFASVRAPTP